MSYNYFTLSSSKKPLTVITAGSAILTGWLFMFGLFQAVDQAILAFFGDRSSLNQSIYLTDRFESAEVKLTKLFKQPESGPNFNKLAPLISAVIITDSPAAKKSDNLTTLVFVGDIMLDRGVGKSVAENFSGDFDALFNQIDFSGADIVFGNLEGPLSDQGNHQGSIYSFRMSPEALSALVGAGFDVFSVANNHVGDFGREAFLDTLNRLKTAGILHPGGGRDKTEAARPQIITKNNTRFGFLAFSDVGPAWLTAYDDQSGILLANDPNFSDIISAAASEVDVLTVSFHFGQEYETVANRRQKLLAKKAIVAGAKIVIGHHPHVPQEVEAYNGGLIAYSLGNFIFDQNFSAETMTGLLLKVVMNGPEIEFWETKTVLLDDSFAPRLANE